MSVKYKSLTGKTTGFVPGVGAIVNGVLTAVQPVTLDPAEWERADQTEEKSAPAAPAATNTPVSQPAEPSAATNQPKTEEKK